MGWLLQINGGEFQSFTELGCVELKRELRSQTPGTFTFRRELQAMDATPIAAINDLAAIFWNDGETNRPFFAGRVTKTPLAGAAGSEAQSYEISDAWSDFERITFQQQWTVITGFDEHGTPTTAYEYRSECLLGVDIDGNPESSAEVIAEVVVWAIARGANCRLGTILMNGAESTAAPVPVDEARDLPVAEIIKKMIRFTPDAVAWFDYSTTPPTFNVTRQAQCAAVSVPFTQQGEGVHVTPRNDLLRPQVVIRYVQDNQTDGQATVVTTVDAAPSGADGLAFGALVATVRLAGSNATFQKQPVQVVPIPTDGSEDGAISWWQNNCPALAQFSADRLQIVVSSTSGTVIPSGYDGDGNPLDLLGNGLNTDIDDYQQQLKSGTLAKWMNVNAANCIWQAAFTYNYPDTPDDESRLAELYFGDIDEYDLSDIEGVIFSVMVVGTNASTQVYQQLSSYTNAEQAPIGMAAALYDALRVLQYEGTWNVIQNEAVPTTRLGIVLNIAGSQQAWNSMNALVQEIVDDLDLGNTTYKFGPAGHLTIQDLMEQLRATRRRVRSRHIKERQTGVPGDTPEVDGASASPGNDSNPPPNPFTGYPWIDYIDEQDNGDGSGATWDALLGYGQSSFSESEEIDHAGPLEKLELSVGNDGSDWTGPDHDATSLTYGFSLIIGDDAPINDQLLIGRLESGGSGGSVIVTPYNPSIDLSPNIDGSIGDGDQFIKINLADLLIQIQDDDSQFMKLDVNAMILTVQDDGGSTITLDLSGNPEVDLENVDGTSIDLTTDDGAAEIYMIDAAGTSSIDINTSDIDGAGGGDASFQQCGTTGGGDAVMVLTTQVFNAIPDAPDASKPGWLVWQPEGFPDPGVMWLQAPDTSGPYAAIWNQSSGWQVWGTQACPDG